MKKDESQVNLLAEPMQQLTAVTTSRNSTQPTQAEPPKRAVFEDREFIAEKLDKAHKKKVGIMNIRKPKSIGRNKRKGKVLNSKTLATMANKTKADAWD